ncbi:MAG TPA: helix-turn-helix transcriptional regulator [Streptosporangiaceae bacterium]|nr:helix-turn-helix transcriptional regulator [Streptosporangiaceae bacterium]
MDVSEGTRNLENLPTRLRKTRWRSGLTQQELAARTGLSARTIGDIERGTVTRPRASTLMLLSEALSMSPAQTEELLLSAREG